MAESICRSLRDGALEGELAPTLTIKDSLASPFAFDVFSYILIQLSSHILAGKSQSQSVCFSKNDNFVFHDYELFCLIILILSLKSYTPIFHFVYRGIVIVALSRSPLSYTALLKMKGMDVASSKKW